MERVGCLNSEARKRQQEKDGERTPRLYTDIYPELEVQKTVYSPEMEKYLENLRIIEVRKQLQNVKL